MANLNIALLFGALLSGVALSGMVADGDDARTQAVRVTLPASTPHRLTSTDTQGEHSTVIEQSDGLVVADAGKVSGDGQAAIARIKAFSDKPVKFLVYTNDHGGRGGEDRAYRQAWPDIVIISTDDDSADSAGGLMDALSTLTNDYSRDITSAIGALARIDLLSPIRTGLGQVVDAGRSILEGYKCLVRMHVRMSATVPKKTMDDGAG